MGDEAIRPAAVEKKFYLFAKLALAAAVVNFIGNAVILVALNVSRTHYGKYPVLAFLDAFDSITFTGILGMCTLCLGLDTIYKYFWPGSTVLARKRKPRKKDLVLALASLVLLLVNLAMLIPFVRILGLA